MISFGRKKKQILLDSSKVISEENERNRKNPARGFYQVYPFDLSEDVNQEYLDTTMHEEDSLCLVEICLKAYKDGEIEEIGVNHLHQILMYFRTRKKDLILRFAYDFDGHAAESEPTNIKLIQTHMEQLLLVVEQYHDIVILMQGLFVGNWGEMHTSRFTTDSSLKKLYETYRMSPAGHIYLAVRTPYMIQMLLDENKAIERKMQKEPTVFKEHLRHLDKIGLFDDAILYNEDDCGTFDQNHFQEEMQFIQKKVIKVPNGGEVLQGEESFSYVNVLSHLQNMHISYLNRQYDRRVLDKWGEDAYGDTNFYDYVEKHLGYCLHMDSITYDPQQYELDIQVINIGFAALMETAECRVMVEQEWTNMDMETGEMVHGFHLEQQANYRVRHASVQSGLTANWILKLNPLKKGKYRVTVKLVRLKDQREIYFSNLNPEDMSRLPIEQP